MDEPSVLATFVAAAIGSCATKAFVYPLETKATLLAISPELDGTIPLSALFHGISFTMYETAFYNGLVWVLKEKIRTMQHVLPGSALTFAQAFAATIMARFVNYPHENIIAGLRSSLRTGAQGPLEVARAILATSGVLGFWQGFHITVFMNGMDAFSIYIYEAMRLLLSPIFPEDLTNFLAGGLSRMFAIFLFYPIKTLQIRSQVAAGGGVQVEMDWSLASYLQLYAGVTAICASEGLKMSFRFVLIERLRRLLHRLLDKPSGTGSEDKQAGGKCE